MQQNEIRYESADGIALITIDRPKKRNALTGAMCDALHAAWRRFAVSDQDRVAILTAAGSDVFTAGADLNDPPSRFWEAVPNVSVPVSKPIIAAVAGPVVGGGVTFVAMCDLCVAAENTRFIYPEAKVGITGGVISSIAARIPYKIAMELLLIGDSMEVARAHQVGLVNRIVPVGEQVAVAKSMASIIAANAPLVVGLLKDVALKTIPRSPVEQMYLTQREVERVRLSEDAKEGPLSFREKRKPNFRGR
jgi:enoyl-CoA hydratase/carnithine racemase